MAAQVRETRSCSDNIGSGIPAHAHKAGEHEAIMKPERSVWYTHILCRTVFVHRRRYAAVEGLVGKYCTGVELCWRS
jgi:hypothetical protein